MYAINNKFCQIVNTLLWFYLCCNKKTWMLGEDTSTLHLIKMPQQYTLYIHMSVMSVLVGILLCSCIWLTSETLIQLSWRFMFNCNNNITPAKLLLDIFSMAQNNYNYNLALSVHSVSVYVYVLYTRLALGYVMSDCSINGIRIFFVNCWFMI